MHRHTYGPTKRLIETAREIFPGSMWRNFAERGHGANGGSLFRRGIERTNPYQASESGSDIMDPNLKMLCTLIRKGSREKKILF